VVVFVLLIVCANVSNLLLVKAFGGAMKSRFGSPSAPGRGRLLKQLLTKG